MAATQRSFNDIFPWSDLKVNAVDSDLKSTDTVTSATIGDPGDEICDGDGKHCSSPHRGKPRCSEQSVSKSLLNEEQLDNENEIEGTRSQRASYYQGTRKHRKSSHTSPTLTISMMGWPTAQ